MTLKIQLDISGLRKHGEAMERAGRKALRKTAADARTDIRLSFGPPPRPGAPSKPGEPPHEQTGALKDSIYYAEQPDGSYHVGSNSRYAKPLESGTRKVSKRPFLGPALDRAARALETNLARQFKQDIK